MGVPGLQPLISPQSGIEAAQGEKILGVAGGIRRASLPHLGCHFLNLITKFRRKVFIY